MIPECHKVRRSTDSQQFCTHFARSRYFTEHTTESVADQHGVKWPTPTPLLLGPGDAAITTYHMPHTPSKNERGAERQQMIYRFALPGTPGGGRPGKPIAQEELDSWRAQLVDCWRGWNGMRDVIAQEQPRTIAAREILQRIFAEEGP